MLLRPDSHARTPAAPTGKSTRSTAGRIRRIRPGEVVTEAAMAQTEFPPDLPEREAGIVTPHDRTPSSPVPLPDRGSSDFQLAAS